MGGGIIIETERFMLEETDTKNTETNTLSDEAKRQIQKIIKSEQDQRQRTWAYYERLRKENPVLYSSPRIQTQIVRDANALGNAFCDGDWEDR